MTGREKASGAFVLRRLGYFDSDPGAHVHIMVRRFHKKPRTRGLWRKGGRFMQEKLLDVRRTVYALCAADPQISKILAEAGFSDITKPGMLTTAGRFMTIPKGAALKGLDMRRIEQIFAGHGYKIIGGDP
jgi:hypothetical protein